MIQTIRKAWGIPELRKKIVFTLLILLIFRVGNAIPTPYINTELLGAYIDSTGGRDRKSTRLNSSHRN